MVCILLGFKIIAEARHTHLHAYRSAKVLNPTPSTSTMAKDIVLGASVQLTGPVANIGRYYRDAYQFATDKINLAGGVCIFSMLDTPV